MLFRMQTKNLFKLQKNLRYNYLREKEKISQHSGHKQ